MTTRDKLAIMGGSNGGLLVGAAMTQRPDLYGAVVCSAPLLDMVRYERFGLSRVRPRSTLVVLRINQVEAHSAVAHIRRGKRQQIAGVIVPVAECDQSLMATAIVPLQSLVSNTAGKELIEDAFQFLELARDRVIGDSQVRTDVVNVAALELISDSGMVGLGFIQTLFTALPIAATLSPIAAPPAHCENENPPAPPLSPHPHRL